ncbi:MAG: tRNA modification GTPase, partial [Candidatus Omnitrophota bacterium]
QSLKIARSHLDGKLSARIKELRDEMTDIVCHMEAHLDFPDDDIDPETQNQIQTRIQKIIKSLQNLIEHSDTGKVIHHGLTVALTGKPNVGKSSLLNMLIDEDRVIVSDTPGTTRDTVEVNMEVAGYHVKLIDTAGFRESKDELENKSLQRAAKIIDEAHVVLFIMDASMELDAVEAERFKSLAHKSLVLVANKEDCMQTANSQVFEGLAGETPFLFTSAKTGQGIVALREAIIVDMQKGQAERSDEILVHSVRQLNLLRQANQYLELALKAFDTKLSLEFPSSDIRLAIDALGEMVGAIVTDDILDKIFSRFCIGK